MRPLFYLLLASLSLTACDRKEGNQRNEDWRQWSSNNGKVKVLTTIAMINDLVATIGDGHVDTLTLIKGELDPHSYQLVKGDDEKLAAAQIIFFNGLGLEHGPSLQSHLYNSPKAIGLGDKIRQASPERILFFKKQIDPHIWMDISLWAETIPFIVEALSEKDPVHAQDYADHGKQLALEFAQKHQLIKTMMEGIPDDHRYLVTSHDAFNYFTWIYLATEQERANGKWEDRFAAPEGLAPESQLSATDIQGIIDHLAKFKIHVVFTESNISKDSIRKIVLAAKEKGLNVGIADTYLYADAMGHPGSDGDSYVKMIEHNAKTIAYFLSQEKNHHD